MLWDVDVLDRNILTFTSDQLALASHMCSLHYGREEVNISSSSYRWEGLLSEDWVACECFGTGEEPQQHPLLTEKSRNNTCFHISVTKKSH